MKTYSISTGRLCIADIRRIFDPVDPLRLVLSDSAREAITECRDYLDAKMADNDGPLYGINTGFGSLCNISIADNELEQLQKNLVMSHSCGMGDKLDEFTVRLMLLLKIQSLSYGCSGVQLETVQRLCDFFNEGVIPVVYSQGSLGASGDLAPLANMCLPLIGLGKVTYEGIEYESADILERFGWEPIRLRSKEGLALLNGTQFMSAHCVGAILEATQLWDNAAVIGAMSLDAFDGRIEPFGAAVNEVRHHRGQIETAARFREILQGSELIAAPKEHVQDPYSFRCIPQVHGAVLDAIDYFTKVVEDEISSPTDNPTVFPDLDLIVSAGNFHGEPIALPMDYLAVALAELANISERRIYKLVSGTRGLPSFLVARPGLNSGFMILQYAAAAAVNQNKMYCWPTSCDSIPSSQGQEDHVSMGANSATKLYKIIDNLRRVLAIELICAAQALDFRRPQESSPVVEDLHAAFRELVPFIEADTPMSPVIETAVAFLR